MRTILLLMAFAAACCSCRTSKMVSTVTASRIIKTDSSATQVDSSKSSHIITSQDQFIFGDTLTGALQFTNEQIAQMDSASIAPVAFEADSIESNGVKVKISLIKNKTGLKVKLQAIAKPVQLVNTRTNFISDQKGIANTASKTVADDTKITASEKVIKGFPWMALIVSAAVVIQISLIFFIYIKNKK